MSEKDRRSGLEIGVGGNLARPVYEQTGFYLSMHQAHSDWHLIPGSTFQDSPCPLLLHAAPLLEEKRDIGSQALILDIHDPFMLQDQSCRLTLLSI
jgi:hypothetical protein